MTPNWFVAWPVTGAKEWLADLEARAPGGLDFLDPADLHVTLAFLGRYEPVACRKLAGLLKTLAIPSISASPGECIALPQPRRFSALSFLLNSGRSETEKLITKWRDRICRDVGAKLETRPPLPHLTVARPQRRIGEEDRAAALDWIEQLPKKSGVSLQLESPRIFTWSERDSTARYRILE